MTLKTQLNFQDFLVGKFIVTVPALRKSRNTQINDLMMQQQFGKTKEKTKPPKWEDVINSEQELVTQKQGNITKNK